MKWKPFPCCLHCSGSTCLGGDCWIVCTVPHFGAYFPCPLTLWRQTHILVLFIVKKTNYASLSPVTLPEMLLSLPLCQHKKKQPLNQHGNNYLLKLLSWDWIPFQHLGLELKSRKLMELRVGGEQCLLRVLVPSHSNCMLLLFQQAREWQAEGVQWAAPHSRVLQLPCWHVPLHRLSLLLSGRRKPQCCRGE